MAGRKQHYLPQHLLRGFEASKTGKKAQVAVYKREAPPYTTSTEGVAAQRDFYSPPGDGVADTLDDVITAFEASTFNPFLDQARTALSGALLDAESAASAVVHLTVRAAHLRGSFAFFARKMIARFGEVVGDPELVREFVDIDSASPASRLSEEIKSAFEAIPTATLPLKARGIFEKMVRLRVREKFDSQMLETASMLREQLSRLEEALPDMAERGHTSALQNSLVPPARIEGLKRLHWKVLAIEPPEHFVLPDCAAVAFTSSGQLQPVAMSSSEEIIWVAMPISAQRVMVGYAGQDPPRLVDLNEQFAKCSLEFLVSSVLNSNVERLSEHIGEALETVTHKLLEESFAAKHPKCEESATDSHTFNIRIVLLGVELNGERRMAIDQSIRQIFTQQCGSREAARLESIVVTNDVAGEVSRLYGRALTPYETSTMMAGTVERIPNADSSALRVFLPEQIVQFLLAPDDRLKRVANLLVKQLLGRLSYLAYWFGDIVPMTEGHVFNRRQLYSLELVQRFASHYHGSIKAAEVAHDSDKKDAEPLCAHAVTVAMAALEAARQAFLIQKNADALLADAALALDMLLGTIAGYCGQRAHNMENVLLLQSSPTCEHIRQAGLWDWTKLFERDLNRHYCSLASGACSVDQMLVLAENVERVLWQFGIFLSDTEDGRIWVDVSGDEQLKMVKQILSS